MLDRALMRANLIVGRIVGFDFTIVPAVSDLDDLAIIPALDVDEPDLQAGRIRLGTLIQDVRPLVIQPRRDPTRGTRTRDRGGLAGGEVMPVTSSPEHTMMLDACGIASGA